MEKRFGAEQAFNHPWVQNSQTDNNNYLSDDALKNMKQFIKAHTFKKTTLMFLASKLPEEFFDDLRRSFIKIDRNGNGKIEE